MLATLDPLGLPLVSQVVAGEKADDPLYIPAIEQVRTGVGRRGLLYAGDCKLMALATRAHLAAGGDHYLAPLALTQLPQAAIDAYLQAVWAEEQALKPLPASQSPDCASLMVANSAPSWHSQPGRLTCSAR
jgi:transposase